MMKVITTKEINREMLGVPQNCISHQICRSAREQGSS